MSTATIQPTDIFDEAMSAQPSVTSRHFFGSVITVDVWACVLQKGVGKVLYDPMVHPASDKRVAIKIEVEVHGRESAYTIKQDTINTAKDWTKFSLASLNAIGANLRDLKGKYVHVERVPTGEFYTSKKEGEQGEQKDRTAIRFLEVFPDEAACRAAQDAFYTPRHGTAAPAAAPSAAPAPADLDANNQAGRLERDQLATQFLPVLWQAAGRTPAPFLSMIAANPLLAKHFNETSPEIIRIIGGEAAPF